MISLLSQNVTSQKLILHETVIRASCDVLESYHSFMQNFKSHKFCDKRLSQFDAKKYFARVFALVFARVFACVFAPCNRSLMEMMWIIEHYGNKSDVKVLYIQ